MPTETIENPSWNAEHHDLCPTGWRLRLACWGDNSQSRKQAYEEHVQGCPACRAYFAELAEAAEKAEHPDIEQFYENS